ncbi:hypothetical protein PHSY_005583 [Pseudozyma hubeiensis SY62]|uniref:Uncharacterized protein n=1 Tax=Pseudozyma hubeiensis (strain SY62) TaxID=1305764 RepID=R9PIR4_PSEHS|nr:hypothetical protein PHSY_005583 [Pseudozyma hubeiensis SY62]GAC97995.1 hypothetical protein PHSY_005583 [Pseudozyma hubeiensis SY62]
MTTFVSEAQMAQATTALAAQPGPYDHLPDLPADISMETDKSIPPTFEQLNATLISRGYLRSPLNASGMREDSLAALADALHAMIAQREEDIEVRTALTAKNRTLTASLERTKRFQKEEIERSADFERKAESSKAKLIHLTNQLEMERTAHKATKEALARMRRDLQAVKASALQYKSCNDRSVARVRARIGEVTSSAIRSAVPDFQIVASAFDEPPTASSSRSGAAGLYAQQVQDLEQKRIHLVEYNQALKRLATEAINAARRADQELLDMVEAEQDDGKKRKDSTLAATKTSGDSGGSRSVSSSSLNSAGGTKRSPSNDTWLDGHRPLFQRDLFPANDTLRSTASGALVSGSSSKASHPALRALELTSNAIHSHVQALLDLRTERSMYYAAQSQRLAAEAREQTWATKLEHDIHQDLENDARLSLNKTNGPSHVGSLASAAIAASSASTSGGASQRIDWQRERVDMEKKLAQLVRQVAQAEQNIERKEKQVAQLVEAEQRARTMLDQASSSPAVSDSEAIEQARSLKSELETAQKERLHFADRCESLEAEARELRNERDRILLQRSNATQPSRVTSLKRLDEHEVAEIHARDQKRRDDLGSLSVVAEDAEMPSSTSTVDTADSASDGALENADFSSSRRSTRKGRLSKDSANAGAISFGESFANNPELDAIFGVSSTAKKVKSVAQTSTRRSSRLSGGNAAEDELSPKGETVQEVDSQTGGRKRKVEEEGEAADSSSTAKRRTSRRISDGSASKATSEEASPRMSKRARGETQVSPSEQPHVTEDAASTDAAATAVAQSRRRLSTREKQELDQKQKTRVVSTPAVAGSASSKTPALTSRRIVSGSSSSVTRPTASSLRRSEATQASVKRPLSNSTNTREGSIRASTASKAAEARVSSSGSIRSRS